MEIFIKGRLQEVQGKEETRTEETLFRLIFELVQINVKSILYTHPLFSAFEQSAKYSTNN